MNNSQLKTLCGSGRGARGRPAGITLFEVLISILVASIGVIGVLILIPFAVKTAERGLDQELALTHARNLFADFESAGYRNTDKWIHVIDDPSTGPVDLFDFPISDSRVYLIDPLRIARTQQEGGGTPAQLIESYARFPYALDVAAQQPSEPRSFFPDELEIPMISLRNFLGDDIDPTDPNYPNDLDVSLARQLFVSPDELVFDESPDNELAGPTQRYTQDVVTGNLVKRQHNGSISSFVFALPDPNVDGQWVLYAVIMKNRDYRAIDLEQGYDPGNPGPNPIPAGLPRVFQVQSPLPAFNNTTLLGYGGGDLVLGEWNAPPSEGVALQDGDWLLLINGIDNTDTSTPETQNIRNMNFYRVIDAQVPDAAGLVRVTVDGPDFQFTAGTGQRPTDPDPLNTAPPNTDTYAILLPKVIGVYERTIRAEGSSIFNN